MTNPFLIGPSVYLRPLEKSDAAMAIAWLNHPDIRRSVASYRPLNLTTEEEFITRISQSDRDMAFVIVRREDEQPIGLTGFHQIDAKNRHAAFGITIGEVDQWDKGHGTEATRLMVEYAFLSLNLNRVWLHVYEDNPRGIRAYEKVGFKKEGVLRQDNFRDGRYWDTIVMAILRDEWQK